MKNTILFAVILVALPGFVGCSPTSIKGASTLANTAIPSMSISTKSAVPSLTPNMDPWQVVHHLQYVHSIYQAGFFDDSFGIMVGYSGVVVYTTDGGQHWSKGNNTSWCRFGLDIVSRQVAWNCGNGGHVRLSVDGGKNWEPVSDFGGTEPNHCRFLSFLDEHTGWAATPQLLGTTTDGGTNWKTIALPKEIKEISAIDLRTGSDGYLLDTAGIIYFTNDGGLTWTTSSLGLADNEELFIANAPTAAIRFTDPQNGIVVFDLEDAVYFARTTDGGKTWKREPLAIMYKTPSLYLAHDGITLTAIDRLSDLTVLRYREH